MTQGWRTGEEARLGHPGGICRRWLLRQGKCCWCFAFGKKNPRTASGRGWRQEQDVGQIHLKAFRSDKWQIPTSHARVHFSFLRNGVGWPPVAPSAPEGWPFGAARLRAPSLRCARTARLKGGHRGVALQQPPYVHQSKTRTSDPEI